MLKENAFIVDIENDVAWVETQRKTSCGSCQARKSCGTSVLQKVLGNKRTRLKVNNPKNYGVGDEVVLGLREDALVKGSLLLYALPLVMMFGFALIGVLLFQVFDTEFSEGFSILFSLTGLGFGFLYVAKSSKNLVDNSKYQAEILEKTGSGYLNNIVVNNVIRRG